VICNEARSCLIPEPAISRSGWAAERSIPVSTESLHVRIDSLATVWACAGTSSHARREHSARISLRSAKVGRLRAEVVQIEQAAAADAEELSAEAEQ
jgi:hypothetical protein